VRVSHLHQTGIVAVMWANRARLRNGWDDGLLVNPDGARNGHAWNRGWWGCVLNGRSKVFYDVDEGGDVIPVVGDQLVSKDHLASVAVPAPQQRRHRAVGAQSSDVKVNPYIHSGYISTGRRSRTAQSGSGPNGRAV
jgi:hypothetical protein